MVLGIMGSSSDNICNIGGVSMKRPACDIFIAGVTQTWPSTYIFLVLISNTWTTQHKSGREEVTVGQILMMVGFYFNAPLFFLYPLLDSWKLQLGSINAFLHSWLCISWTMQGIGMLLFCYNYSGYQRYKGGTSSSFAKEMDEKLK